MISSQRHVVINCWGQNLFLKFVKETCYLFLDQLSTVKKRQISFVLKLFPLEIDTVEMEWQGFFSIFLQGTTINWMPKISLQNYLYVICQIPIAKNRTCITYSNNTIMDK